MSKTESNFVARCLAGDALVDDIDDYIDRWHDGEGSPDESLAEFLGFTDEEYKLWAENPDFLPFILNARAGIRGPYSDAGRNSDAGRTAT